MFKSLFKKKDHFGGYLPEAPDMPQLRITNPDAELYSLESGYPQTGTRGGADLTDAEYRDMTLYEHRGVPAVWYPMRDMFAAMNKEEFARYRKDAMQSAIAQSDDTDEETPQEEYDAIMALREDLKAEDGATDEELDEILPVPVLPA